VAYFIYKKPGSPSCELAGVTPGKLYEDREEAMRDLASLNEVNPVGFAISEVHQGACDGCCKVADVSCQSDAAGCVGWLCKACEKGERQ